MSTLLGSGASVAGFRIDRPIGGGATGTVYLGQASGGRRVAVKLLAPELARDERFRQRFLRESKIAAGLEAPHIVRTVASGEEAGQLYLVMEYVDGTDLRELLRREGALAPERAVRLVQQVADALDAAHAAGLVHRDVKPGNILVTRSDGDDEAWICDFGLARHVSSVSSLTGERGFVGTIDYVPPEQIAGSTIDARADVYALGCVLFECLTAERPFPRESELSVVFAHLNEPPPRANEILPELPPAFDDVFRKALAKSPNDRYSTCGELAQAARAALHGIAARHTRVRRRSILIAAGVGIAVVAAVGTLLGMEATPTHRTAMPEITQRAIDGLTLGHLPSYYARRLGGYKPSILGGPEYPTMSFQQPEVAVYFPAQRKPAQIITTWNPNFRTANGIGPCSTLAAMRRAYGKRAHTNWSGTSPDGKKHFSWQLGRNILFETQDQRTISTVVLFKGVAVEKHGGSPRDWANYVGANETACK
jgi:tRNA A-37 threonylcarbamoyl transferase component Bud32